MNQFNFIVDLYDGADGQPRIFHSKTLTSKLLFEDALIAIKEYAFKITEYNSIFCFKKLYLLLMNFFDSLPLIITIELHCSAQQQRVMAFLIKKYLKGELMLI